MNNPMVSPARNSSHTLCTATIVPTTTSSGRRHRRARRRQKKRELVAVTNGTVKNAASVYQSVGLLGLPDEMLVMIIRWALPREPADVIEAVASLRSCCTRFDALCQMPSIEATNVDPRLVPFARCGADEYDPSAIPDDGRLIRAAGLARAPRLRQKFVQTCTRYAIYSLIASSSGPMSPELDKVSFSSFARPASTLSFMARAFAPVCDLFIYNHIEVCEYNSATIKVEACTKSTSELFKPKPTPLDDGTRGTINGALVEAATRAMDATDEPCERRAVIDSIDLFEAYPNCIDHVCATPLGSSWQAAPGRRLTRVCTVDISSVACS